MRNMPWHRQGLGSREGPRTITKPLTSALSPRQRGERELRRQNMSIRPTALGGLALTLLLGFFAAQPATAEEQAATAACADCHDQAKAFDANPHMRIKVANVKD